MRSTSDQLPGGIPCEQSSEAGATALVAAAEGGQLESARRLLEAPDALD